MACILHGAHNFGKGKERDETWQWKCDLLYCGRNMVVEM